MKKLAFFGITLALASLVGCTPNGSSSKYNTPTTPYEKVKVAFSGVENSFKNIQTGNNKLKERNLLKSNSDSTLSSLYSLYTSGDNQGSTIDDLSYTQPPMIQFQCLKYSFDKIGSGYSFGTKYYDNVTGKVYIDFETGVEAEKTSDYEYNYDFTLALDINIDNDDYITADVSFSITITKGINEYHVDWYVNMLLDYDMDKESPTYVLTMLTNNDERNLPYYNRCTYEYDYVEVNNNKINEWRKFDLEAPIPLRKEEGQTFDFYINSGVDYTIGTFSWYKNNVFNKAKNINKEENRKPQVAKLFFELGLNSSDIDSVPFSSKQGTKNAIIKTMYEEFSSIFRKDIIYSLVTRDEEEQHHEDNVPRYLQIVNFDGNNPMSENDECFLADKEATFGSLITNVAVYSKDGYFIPKFNILNQSDVVIREALLEEISIKAINNENQKVSVDTSSKVVDFVNQQHMPILKLELSLLVDNGVADSKILTVNCNPFSDSINGWPFAAINSMGLSNYIPPFATSSYYGAVERVNYQEGYLACEIMMEGLDQNDISNYQKSLEEKGLGKASKEAEYVFADTSRNIVFKVWIEGSGDYANLKIEQTSEYFCTYSQKDKTIFAPLNQDVLLPEGLVFNHPNNLDEFFDYYGVSSAVFDDFIKKLTDNGWKQATNTSEYKYYYDYEDVRYRIDYLTDNSYVLTVVYSTGEIPSEKLDMAELFVGDISLPMENDVDGNLSTVFNFTSGQSFYIIGSKDHHAVTLGYKNLEQNDVASKFLSQGNNDTILVKADVILKIRIIHSNNKNTIVCSRVNEGGGESGSTDPNFGFKTVSLVGSFNEWNEKSDDYNFTYNDGAYKIELDLAAEDQFKIVFDHDWNGAYGYDEVKEFAKYSNLFAKEATYGNVICLKSIHMIITINSRDGTTVFTVAAREK